MPTPHRIERNYDRAFFNRRKQNRFRIIFIGVMLTLIFGLPLLLLWQLSNIQFAVLEAAGIAPTATPFASVRASQAQEAYLRGDVLSALELYEQAVRQQPQNASYLYEYGKMLIEADRSTEAAAVGQQIIDIAPNDPRGFALRANALMWNDPAAAIPVAISGTEVDNGFAPLHAALSVAYTNLDRYQEGLQRGDLAIRLDPTDANARRSYSYPLIFTGRYTEAIAQLEEAIAINPNVTAPYFELASLYRRINQEEMAVAIYNRVVDLDPTNARAYLRLCETFAAVGLFQDAEVYCDQALIIDPEYGSAHRMRGQLRYSRRNYEGAIDSFNRCVELGASDPDSIEIECYYIRGLAYYFLAQCDNAWETLTIASGRTNAEPIVRSINIGLSSVIRDCAGYQGRLLPTAIPPTAIPPTPIGGG